MTHTRWAGMILLCLGLLTWGCAQVTGTPPGPSLAKPAAQVGATQVMPGQGEAASISSATTAPAAGATLTVTPPSRATAITEPVVTPSVLPQLEDRTGAATPMATVAPTAPAPTATSTPTLTATVAPTVPATSTTITPGLASTVVPAATPNNAAVATPGPTPDGTPRTVRVPILMYHYISAPPKGADIYRQDLSVTPERFESHLAYLRDHGYHVITLDDLLYALTQGRALPEKPVILTFDDGYADNYANAFPLLHKYGDVGEFFVITDFINQARPEYMSWSQIEEMAAAGQRFGSHSRDHPDLRGKPVDYLVWQALGGTEAIQEHLGYHPRWIAYPSGAYDKRVIDVFHSANYWGGLSTEQGATHSSADLFDLRRVRVRGRYTAEDLGRLLEANW